MSSSLTRTLEENKKAVDEVVFSFLPERHSITEVDLLYRIMKEYPSRPAKGLRPSLCITVCEAFGGSKERALNTASALELFQNWILIHDDIEDASDMRRGSPALHKKYGTALSINAGDALHAKMWECLLRNREMVGGEKTLTILKEVSRMINETTEGQHVELSWVEGNRWDLKEEDYFLMCEKKTSWYTCITPCRLGAIIADAPCEKIDMLIPFGRSLGIAFQIKDDLLNLEAAGGRYGKEIWGDVWEGKRTLVLIHLLEVCSIDDREWVLKVMSKRRGDKDPSEVEKVVRLMRDYGSLEYAKKKAEDLARATRSVFLEIFGDAPCKDSVNVLSELVDFMVTRQW